MLSALEACPTRFDHVLPVPAENKTSFIETHPHVHGVHSVVHVQLDHRSISSISNVRILFIPHHNVSGSDNLGFENERFDNTRTSECYTSLNSLVCLEWNSFSPKSLMICSPFVGTREHSFKHDMPRCSRVHGGSDFHPFVLHFLLDGLSSPFVCLATAHFFRQTPRLQLFLVVRCFFNVFTVVFIDGVQIVVAIPFDTTPLCALFYHKSDMLCCLPCHISLALCFLSYHCPSAVSSFLPVLNLCHLCHLLSCFFFKKKKTRL